MSKRHQTLRLPDLNSAVPNTPAMKRLLADLLYLADRLGVTFFSMILFPQSEQYLLEPRNRIFSSQMRMCKLPSF